MFVSGDPLRSPGPRGEQQFDTSFVLWFNAGRRARPRHAARERLGAARRGRALHRPQAPGRHAGQGRRPDQLRRQSVVVLRERAAADQLAERAVRAREPAVGSTIVDPVRRRVAQRRQRRASSRSGQRDDAQLGDRGQQLVARDDPHRVAERADAVQDDVAVEAVAAALVGLGQRRAPRPWCRRAGPRCRSCRARPGRGRRRARGRRARRRRGRVSIAPTSGASPTPLLSTCSTRTLGQAVRTFFFQPASSAAPA